MTTTAFAVTVADMTAAAAAEASRQNAAVAADEVLEAVESSSAEDDLAADELAALFTNFATSEVDSGSGTAERVMDLAGFNKLLSAIYRKDLKFLYSKPSRKAPLRGASHLPTGFCEKVFNELLQKEATGHVNLSWPEFEALFNLYWTNRHQLLMAYVRSKRTKQPQHSRAHASGGGVSTVAGTEVGVSVSVPKLPLPLPQDATKQPPTVPGNGHGTVGKKGSDSESQTDKKVQKKKKVAGGIASVPVKEVTEVQNDSIDPPQTVIPLEATAASTTSGQALAPKKEHQISRVVTQNDSTHDYVARKHAELHYQGAMKHVLTSEHTKVMNNLLAESLSPPRRHGHPPHTSTPVSGYVATLNHIAPHREIHMNGPNAAYPQHNHALYAGPSAYFGPPPRHSEALYDPRMPHNASNFAHFHAPHIDPSDLPASHPHPPPSHTANDTALKSLAVEAENQSLKAELQRTEERLKEETDKRRQLKQEYENYLLQQCFDLSTFHTELLQQDVPAASVLQRSLRKQKEDAIKENSEEEEANAEAKALSVLSRLESAVLRQCEELERVRTDTNLRIQKLGHRLSSAKQAAEEANEKHRKAPKRRPVYPVWHDPDTLKRRPADKATDVDREVHRMIGGAIRTILPEKRGSESKQDSVPTQKSATARAYRYLAATRGSRTPAARTNTRADARRPSSLGRLNGTVISSKQKPPSAQDLAVLWRKEADALKKRLVGGYSQQDEEDTHEGTEAGVDGQVAVFASLEEYRQAEQTVQAIRDFLTTKCPDGELSSAFRLADVWQTGYVTLLELQQVLRTHRFPAKGHSISAAFHLLDGRSRGRVSQRDFCTPLQQLRDRSVVIMRRSRA